ncbi:MAG: carboxypeptidase regulatory-like domain-containing protein [Flavobacteriales bacterium]
MMKKITSTFILLAIISSSAFAQLKSANKRYANLAYANAIPKFERVVKKDPANFDALCKLADCYRLTKDMANAEATYAKIVADPAAKPEHLIYYTQSLMENEKYTEAQIWADKYQAVASGDSRADNLKKGLSEISNYKASENVYTVKKASLNSQQGDFSPTLYNSGVVFASNRTSVQVIGYDHSWTGKQFYQLYHAKGEEDKFAAATPFATALHTRLYDGPVCFNSTGSQMFFTRSNIENGSIRKDKNDVIQLKIFSSQWSEGKWGIEVPFIHNNDNYSCAHPSLSTDSKTLYFSSDMPGGQGGMDIWKCNWNGTSWDTPVNLGAEINTAGTEVFPTIHHDGTLYFSSNGQPGLGGLDIYFSAAKNNALSKPVNMGSPINSSNDDFGICLKADGMSGYFTSNRKAQGTNDDIYYFKKQCTNADVVIIDETSSEPLSDAEVKVFENGEQKSIMMTDGSGKFNMCLNPLSNYEFRAQKNDYTENKSSLSSSQIAAAAATGTEVKVPLKKKPQIIADVAGKVFNADDKSPVAGQVVTLKNTTTGETMTATTDANGQYKFSNLPLNNEYVVSTSKKDCGEVNEPFNTNNLKASRVITMDMPLLCKGDIIKIENIYYDYNKYNIRADAALELDKVVAILNKYPNMTIELRSHTDSRGKDAYNTTLSDNRAKSAVEYIISKGIPKNRLIAKGYGESDLLNHCKNGVECDDKTHEQNRRTEFKILSM